MSCKGCAYAVCLSGAWCCDYLSITGHCRPCPPGEGCTVRKAAEMDPKRKWKGDIPVKGQTWDTEKARALYEQDWSDARIAKEVGTTAASVARWRKELGLPSLIERRGVCAEKSPSPSPPSRPLALPAVKGPVELSIEMDGHAFALRAPDLEGAARIHEYAGRLLKDMGQAAARLTEGINNA